MMILLSNKVHAADELDVTTFDTVTVSAIKMKKSTFDTTDSVDIVDGEKLEEKQAQTLSDVLKNIPGVSFTGGPRGVAEKPVIRGLSGSRILITVDGARQNFNSGHKGRIFIEPDLLKSVEVLKGAGSSIWGSGAMGGVIAMTTKDAEDFIQDDELMGVRIKGGFQNNNKDILTNGILYGVLPVAGDLSYLLSGTFRDSDNIKVGGDEVLEDSSERTFANLSKLTWNVDDSQKIKLSRQYNLDTGEVPAQADFRTSVTAVLTDRETEVENWRLSYDYTSMTPGLAAGLYIYDNKMEEREKRIGTNGRLDIINYETSGLDARVTVVGDLGVMENTLVAGIEYYQDKQISKKGVEIYRAFPDATADFYGVYLQDEIEFANAFVLSPGVRFDNYESKTDDASLDVTSIKESKVSPKLGLMFKVSSEMRLFASYSESFRAPNFQELYISGVHFGANEFKPPEEVLDPETSENKEIGFRYKSANTQNSISDFRLDAFIYVNDYEDFIDTFVTSSVTSFRNVTVAEIKGLELTARYLHKATNIDASLSYNLSEGTDVTEDEPLGSIPGALTIVNVTKQLQEVDAMFGVRASFSQTQDKVSGDQPETSAYNLYDMYLAWYPDVNPKYDFRIDFGIDNFMDERYKKHLAEIESMGRNIKISASFQF